MGVSENVGLLDSGLWAGKAFDGGWLTALSAVRDVKEPATGQVLSRVGIASAADMTSAIGRAHAAQPAWAAMAPRERSAVFHRAAALFQRHFAQQFRFRVLSVVAFDGIGLCFQQQFFRREACILVLGSLFRHVQDAADESG